MKVVLLAEAPLPDQEARAGEGDLEAAGVVWVGVIFVAVEVAGLLV